ncbi:MAG: hypothetical protein AABY15_03315 [Nanoarchaeota archaeon]
MKIIIAFIMTMVIFCGCSDPAPTTQHTESAKRIDVVWTDENGNTDSEEFVIIEIDSCEYLYAFHDRGAMITHKGNCKFCSNKLK